MKNNLACKSMAQFFVGFVSYFTCCVPRLFRLLFDWFTLTSGPKVIKHLSCSTQLSTKFIMLISIKMPTIVGILTFISMISTSSDSLKASKVFIFQHCSFYEQLKLHAQLS